MNESTRGVMIFLAATKVLQSYLWGVTATDLPTFVIVVLTLLAAVLAACYLPARKALKIDPAAALRCD
jgi:putative ABC transport system permease protein